MAAEKKSNLKPKVESQGEGKMPSPEPSAPEPRGSRENPKESRGVLFTPAGCSLKYKKRWLLPGDKSDFADLSDEERSLLLDKGKIKKI